MADNKYEVTIGIPVYNVEKYIRTSLESALSQTFQKIEFLICDDCGKDSSMNIVKDCQQNHPRGKDIHIVRQAKNMGIGNARNRLIDEAQGKYLFFMDADDTITPDAIELLHNAAVRYNAELVYGSRENVYTQADKEKVVSYIYEAKQFLNEDDFANYVYQRYDNIQAQVWNFLIDIDIYRRNHLRFEDLNFWEDFMMTMDLPTYVTRVVTLPTVTYHYYCRNGSLSNFQKRDFISKDEIMHVAHSLTKLKDGSNRIRHKSYFSLRMKKLMTTSFYVVCTVFRQHSVITPPVTNRELRDMMSCPLTLRDILHFRQARLSNLMLYILGVLPPFFSVFLMERIGKAKGLVT